MKKDDQLAKEYQKKSDKQHVLDNPDTYIGSVEHVDTTLHVFNNDTNIIVEKQINMIPGLYKLFDEGIVNCRDHAVRLAKKIFDAKLDCLPVTYINIDIDEADGTITMMNDGNGIDVAEHPEYKIWIPELIFGHLRTSTNYDKTEQKITGGKNGFGFKLVLIWSTWGKIETVDHIRGLKYVQEFKNNLDEICKPTITKYKGKPYTKISFRPDYRRLKIKQDGGLSPDTIALFKRRVYDIAAVTDKTIRVKYNGDLVAIKTFQQYVDLYIGSKSDTTRIYEEEGERWEYAVCLAPNDEFAQVSFVNGIYTNKGGKHVEYILNQIIRKLIVYIKAKRHVDVKATTIKEQIMLFLRCDIENPSFDSQTKDYMNTPVSNFGSVCTVSDKFIEKIAKMGVMNASCALTEVKDNKLAKKTDGSKTKNIRNIPKLIDANLAGTDKSRECTIIFCEGDSAKAGIVSGLSKEDRNYIGVYPMKGKLFNVRGEAAIKIAENKEIAEIKQILGLETGKEYTREIIDLKLRYGKLLFMTDQDLDGSHIKGLGLNLFDSEWKSLSLVKNFIGFMNTPILKAKKATQELAFYNEGEYEAWKENNTATIHLWKIKYYKGLGTSTAKEFKEYFQNKKIVLFNPELDNDNILDMVFNKKRSDDRKVWLSAYDRKLFIDTNKEEVTYKEFIDKELIHFSKYDCDRSIPNLMDGLKISQRKILFSGFKKNLKNEIKVAQFSGYVSEHAGYHHGEASLNGAIVNMAQNYVGSNNINLFNPNGQFGTRLAPSGKDSASERYIFTQLNSLTRLIFPEIDDKILTYLDDDGQIVEPIYYAPIIPMILVNGSKGIGTGFSTDIMCHNPLEIIAYIKNKLNATNLELTVNPYYEGFKGEIIKITESKYLIKGVYSVSGNKVHVTELPVGFATDDYKQYLEELIENNKTGGKKNDDTKETKDKEKEKKEKEKEKKEKKESKKISIKDYNDMSTDCIVDFEIVFAPGIIDELLNNKLDDHTNELEKVLKLYTTQSTTNIHAFDSQERLKKYNKVESMIDDYYITRMELYVVRKTHQLNQLSDELVVLSNKARYIQETLTDVIDLRKKSKDEINTMLQQMKFQKIDDDFRYLVKMPMDSVSIENVERLLRDKSDKEALYKTLEKKSIETIWNEELDVLKTAYMEYKTGREALLLVPDKKTTKPIAKVKRLKMAD